MSQTTELVGGSGISQELAAQRSGAVRRPAIALRLTIPETGEAAVTGRVRLGFEIAAAASLPPIDFAPTDGTGREGKASAAGIHALRLNGQEVPYEHRDGQIRIAAAAPTAGLQHVEIEFTAGAGCLKRRSDLAYTLFVPAHAHALFPCFDQPDLRTKLSLELEVPATWSALANAPVCEQTAAGDRTVFRFEETESLPTYLFAFLAGRFRAVESTQHGRRLILYCTPSGAALLDDNREAIFGLHARALDFLERYTGIRCPFEPHSFVLIPDFEFGGMEHPGAVFYREQLLLLPPGAPQSEIVRRANLIAHETAHLWFGDLVTMRWFDDVWLKEVFANFMADKIVAEAFPDADHELGFLLRHFPPALAIDRSRGTHAIRRRLDHLGDAAALYDALIYHKAPIAIAELERAIGETAMRAGLAEWLHEHRFGNVDWPSLLMKLAGRTNRNLIAFSRRWIESSGPPRLPGRLAIAKRPRYGLFVLTAADRAAALRILERDDKPLRRAQAWIALFEDMLAGGLSPAGLLTAALGPITREEGLLLDRILADVTQIFWRFLSPAQRALAAGAVERSLILRSTAATNEAAARIWLGHLATFALSDELLADIEETWRSGDARNGRMPESLDDRLTLLLALKRPEHAEEILATRLERAQSAESVARLQFLAPAVSPEPRTREAFFERLLTGDGRSLWQVSGLALINHALRADQTAGWLEAGLRRGAQLHASGEIFFPRQWLDALFSGHGTREAGAIIESFLESEGLTPLYRELVLQTADLTLRAARIRA